jgi:hypothetical protein
LFRGDALEEQPIMRSTGKTAMDRDLVLPSRGCLLDFFAEGHDKFVVHL